MALKLDEIETPERVTGAIADYGRLEGSGWKARQGTAVRLDNAQGRFYCCVFETYCRMGKGRTFRLPDDGRITRVEFYGKPME